MSLLEVNDVNVYYGDVHVLWDVSFKVEEKEIVSIVGSNGAGKTTILKTISGLLHPLTGKINFFDQQINSLPSHEIAKRGIIQIPEGRRLFPLMTILENLMVGAYAVKSKQETKNDIRMVFKMFPRLEERKNQLAMTLSGGEQQMLAIGRGLMAKPKILMFDEPSLGLAPILVEEVFKIIHNINTLGTTILLVEQNIQHSLSISSRGYVLENGKVVLEGKGKDLIQDSHVKKAYLGI